MRSKLSSCCQIPLHRAYIVLDFHQQCISTASPTNQVSLSFGGVAKRRVEERPQGGLRRRPAYPGLPQGPPHALAPPLGAASALTGLSGAGEIRLCAIRTKEEAQ